MKLKISFLLLLSIFFSITSCIPIEGISTNETFDTVITSETLTPIIQATLENYTGVIFPPLPPQLQEGPGMSITSLSTERWGISIVADGELYLLWLTKSVYNDKGGYLLKEVVDSLVLPNPSIDQKIIVDQCMLNESFDPEIVVLANIDEKSFNNRFIDHTNIVQAWRANRSIGKFEKLDFLEVTCYVETVLDYPWIDEWGIP